MAQIRSPEEVLFTFSQWLQQWTDYALSQAQLFAASTSLGDQAGDTHAAGSPPEAQENQPPAHWLELIPPGPPAHWLALFEEYGLEPPKTDAPPGDVQSGSQAPDESTPRPLQDWLGEFQRGLAQFAQQPVSLAPDQYPVLPEDAAPPPTPFLHGKDLTTDSAPPSHIQDKSVPGRQEVHLESQGAGDQAEPAASAAPHDHVLTPDPHPAQHGGEVKFSTPVRLRLNPQPPAAMPVPVPSPLPSIGESTQPALIQPAQTAPRPITLLHIGVPALAAEPLPAKSAPPVELIGESRPGEAVHHLSPRESQANATTPARSAEAEPLPETDLDRIQPMLKGQMEQSPSKWSQTTTAHWPELPERLPPVQPPSNVLADPAHRMRINREQRGRTWTA